MTFFDLESIHFSHSFFGILNIFILDECETLAFTSLWISMNINKLNGTERIKQFSQIVFINIFQITHQTSNLKFGLPLLGLSLLFIWINLFGYFHLSKIRLKKLLCSSRSSVLFCLRMLNF